MSKTRLMEQPEAVEQVIAPGDVVAMSSNPRAAAVRQGDRFYVNGPFGPDLTGPLPAGVEPRGFSVYPFDVLDQRGTVWTWSWAKKRWDRATVLFPAPKQVGS